MRESAPVLKLMVAGARLANPALSLTDSETLVTAVTSTLRAVRREFPRARPGAPDQGNEIVWSVYCMNPVAPEETHTWEHTLCKLQVVTYYGIGEGRAPYACGYCQGRDHPTVGCTLQKRPDWFDTELLNAEEVPGQNAALTENAASRKDGARGRGRPWAQPRGGRGRERGRGRGRGFDGNTAV
jgi:hypothetical protein